MSPNFSNRSTFIKHTSARHGVTWRKYSALSLFSRMTELRLLWSSSGAGSGVDRSPEVWLTSFTALCEL